VSHGKNQQRKNNQRHQKIKRLLQKQKAATRPAQRRSARIPDVPGYIQEQYINLRRHDGDRALAAYRAGVVFGLLRQVRDLLLRRIDQLHSEELSPLEVAAIGNAHLAHRAYMEDAEAVRESWRKDESLNS
jgi:hypothetical protein